MTTRTGEVFGHEGLSGCDTDAGEVYAHEQLSRTDPSTEDVCTIYSIQAVAGVGTAGCAIAGLDYGRRP